MLARFSDQKNRTWIPSLAILGGNSFSVMLGLPIKVTQVSGVSIHCNMGAFVVSLDCALLLGALGETESPSQPLYSLTRGSASPPQAPPDTSSSLSSGSDQRQEKPLQAASLVSASTTWDPAAHILFWFVTGRGHWEARMSRRNAEQYLKQLSCHRGQKQHLSPWVVVRIK